MTSLRLWHSYGTWTPQEDNDPSLGALLFMSQSYTPSPDVPIKLRTSYILNFSMSKPNLAMHLTNEQLKIMIPELERMRNEYARGSDEYLALDSRLRQLDKAYSERKLASPSPQRTSSIIATHHELAMWSAVTFVCVSGSMATTVASMSRASSTVPSASYFSRPKNTDAFVAGQYVPNIVTAGTRTDALNVTRGWIVKGNFQKCR
jgi:hypothetical protein